MAGSKGWVMRAPYSRWGRGKWREAWELCGATQNPCLTCRDCTHPAPSPALPPHPSATRAGRGRARPEPQEGCGVEGRCGEGHVPQVSRTQPRTGSSPGLSQVGLSGGQESPFPNPQPWPRGSSSTSHSTRPRPSPLPPPNNNQRKRKRCHLPMPALRVSKPSGMGGARQLLGAWRGGGLPGGGTRDRLPGAPKLT